MTNVSTSLVPPPLIPSRNPVGIYIQKRTLLLIGVLIGMCGIVGFLLGYWFGVRSVSKIVVVDGPFQIMGFVSEGDSIVLLLPESERPDKKMDFKNLRAAMLARRSEESSEYQQIRGVGGDCVVTDQEGRFETIVESADRYFVLAISTHGRTHAYAPVTATLAQLGRYFLNGNDILESANFAWIAIDVRADINLEISVDS